MACLPKLTTPPSLQGQKTQSTRTVFLPAGIQGTLRGAFSGSDTKWLHTSCPSSLTVGTHSTLEQSLSSELLYNMPQIPADVEMRAAWSLLTIATHWKSQCVLCTTHPGSWDLNQVLLLKPGLYQLSHIPSASRTFCSSGLGLLFEAGSCCVA